jgi:protein tyrosine phosphatase (PTP) superfamily phosphohydrolase (DUF442 family)
VNISQITDHLFVGGQPLKAHAPDLCALGIGLVISMRAEKRPDPVFNQPPLRSLWLPTFDTFFTPIPLRALEAGVRAALPVIEAGHGVLVHCHQGVHRSVALAAAVLIAQGRSAPDAMRLLRQQRPAADPHIWYIRRRIELFARRWAPPAVPQPGASPP